MSGRKYLWAILASILFLATVAQFWWNHHLASITVVTGEKQVAPYQAIMEERLFNIQKDGILRLSYRLNDDPELRAAGFECRLVHKTETNPERTAARSQWELPFIESYVVPFDLADLLWRTPAGDTLVFRNARLNQTSTYQGTEDWELKKLGPMSYVIYNVWGDRFIYAHGLLSEVATRSGRHYRVTTRGGLVTSMMEMGGPNSGRMLFSAEFDDFGHCTEVKFPGRLAERFVWSAQGFLQSWESGSGRRLGFQYKDGLLVRVTEPGKADFPITWSQNKDYVNAAVLSGEPVYVTSAGDRKYRLSYSSHGLAIAIECPDKGQDSTAILSFPTHSIILKFAGQTWQFYFPDMDGMFRSNEVEITGSAK